MFATRLDLLKRSNASRLAQLAVPADRAMVDEEALRLAINEVSLTDYSDEDQASLTLALDAIDNALADADALILSYGIPESVQTTLLARIASTIALYYLQGTERATDATTQAYDAVIAMLVNHGKGVLSLIPPVITDPPEPVGDGAEITANPTRYGGYVVTDF